MGILNYSNLFAGEDGKFDVVYGCWTGEFPEKQWLDSVKNQWGATAIFLKVNWDEVEPEMGRYEWTKLNNSINNIINESLKVYIRISGGNNIPGWIEDHKTGRRFLPDDCFQTYSDGKIFSQYGWYPLNIGNAQSRQLLIAYFTGVMNHLSEKYGSKIEYVFPSISADNEMEYAGGIMLGYSPSEIRKFRDYLGKIYDGDVIKLNSRWNSDFDRGKNFDDINPAHYRWENAAPFSSYQYASGRVDWIEYHTSQLKELIDTCAKIAHYNDLKIGIEFGSIYDYGIEFRGWYDPTFLAENIDFLKIADIVEYKPNFKFAANYVRSICGFWSAVSGKKIKFATETNWPYWNGHSARLLCNDWLEQLKAYHENGASAHFIYGWNTERTPGDSKGGAILDSLNSWKKTYNKWRNKLIELRNKTVERSPVYSKMIHLSCEQGNFEGNKAYPYGDSVYLKMNFLNSLSCELSKFDKTEDLEWNFDIVTSKMMVYSPAYLNNYSTIYLTRGSKYISDKAYSVLIQRNIGKQIDVNKLSGNNTIMNFYNSLGTRNEYNNIKIPVYYYKQ